MRFSTIDDGTRDGRLVLVSADQSRMTPAGVPNLQAAIEKWADLEPDFRRRAEMLEAGKDPLDEAYSIDATLAPLPRAWQWLDGSAFESHGDLMSSVFGMDPPPRDRPLMYQGVSDRFYPSHADVPFPSIDDGIDFEGEFGVITDSVPLGVTAAEAMKHIRLIVLINDWSLRSIAPIEMKTGFGWIQAKPPCSLAPIAVTPDELGSDWKDGRVNLPLKVWRNGEVFGQPNGKEMAFGFHDLIAHAARTRSLVAGTIIGSGTVSNADFKTAGSACITERRGIELLEIGKAVTPFLQFGEQVRMSATSSSGAPLFGTLDQKVVQAS